MREKEERLITQRLTLYLCLVLGFLFGCGVVAAVLPEEQGQALYRFLAAFFTAVPVLGAVLTRVFTGDKSPLHVDLRVWKNWKMWAFSAFMPGIAILLGIVIFYAVYPGDLDLKGTYLIEHFGPWLGNGAEAVTDMHLTAGSVFRAGVITVFIAAACIPLQLLELGEEIGWRGYFLPLLCRKMSPRKTVLASGILWGIAHGPIIFFGFNYGSEYAGAPWTGIVMMTFLGVVIGVWTSYVMLKTGNCMYSAIVHGVVNLIGETGVFVSAGTKSPLLGPNPTGIVSMSVLFIGAALLFTRISSVSPISAEE